MNNIPSLRTLDLSSYLHMDRGIFLIVIRVFLKPHSKGESGYRNLMCSKLLKLGLNEIGNSLLSWFKMLWFFHHLQNLQNFIKDVLNKSWGMSLLTCETFLIELKTILFNLQSKVVFL